MYLIHLFVYQFTSEVQNRGALHFSGDYMLIPRQEHYRIPDQLWRCKTSEEKNYIFVDCGFQFTANLKTWFMLSALLFVHSFSDISLL
jgi:hypothetical protein